jgi:threonine/homoserine/homoserine lactone efflux protein
MTFENWLAFTAASAIMLAIPGPVILLVVSYALGHGKKATGATVAGVTLGDFTAMTASMLGLGALLMASSGLFTVLKWGGALYLIYLGIKLWRAPVGDMNADGANLRADDKPLSIFLHTYVVTALNPKSIIFFVAFLPQFLVPGEALLPQMVLFETTFLILATLNAGLYALLASAARDKIKKPSVQTMINRIGGGLLISAAVLALSWKRSAA